mmetsp:Transcript_26004/g.78361  ORF Transcript_26004/g.78361 Transcript_26004/m.78361 type:complete len:228 (-) Transcript_26004:724-1407(-)
MAASPPLHALQLVVLQQSRHFRLPAVVFGDAGARDEDAVPAHFELRLHAELRGEEAQVIAKVRDPALLGSHLAQGPWGELRDDNLFLAFWRLHRRRSRRAPNAGALDERDVRLRVRHGERHARDHLLGDVDGCLGMQCQLLGAQDPGGALGQRRRQNQLVHEVLVQGRSGGQLRLQRLERLLGGSVPNVVKPVVPLPLHGPRRSVEHASGGGLDHDLERGHEGPPVG